MCGKKPTNPHKRKGIPYRTYLHKRANSRYRSRTCYFLLRRQAWLSVPLICSAVWRSRTSKSFPTECSANISNTIIGIRHVVAQFLDTQLTNSTLRLPEGVVPSKWSWWSEIRTHEPEGTDLQSACFVHLHIHQCQRCVFAELSPLIKQVSWFFMRIHTTVLTFGYSLWLSISPQRYWVDFHL